MKNKIKSPGFNVPMDIPPPESVYGRQFSELKKHILYVMEEHWGPRCKTKDYEDFPDLEPLNAIGDPDNGRCPACLVYEKFDNFWEYFSNEND